MGKLILRLSDGATREIPLDRERLVIGRRADNHVCLPYPAVSAEHAAVVTILDDSFLEDLNSTNGTLVNGKAVTKHFLRDHDEIDIGRQMLVYFSGEYSAEMVEASLPQANGGSGKPPASSAAMQHEPLSALIEGTTLAPGAAGTVDGTSIDTDKLFAPSMRQGAPAAAESAVAAPPRITVPVLEVLDGPRAGHTVNITHEEFVIGRVGVQLAAIRSGAEGYRLVSLEGELPPHINGIALPAPGSLLAPGDRLVIAGTTIAFRAAGGTSAAAVGDRAGRR